MNIRTFRLLVIGLAAVGLWQACKPYHDTTARFNAYFLAKEKILEVENTLFGNPKNDYNDVLQVLTPIDTNETKSQKAGFEYVIEKASLPIQFHERSKWVDDCYYLIGKARMYQGDYMNAVLTFKYINANSEEDPTRHAALIQLMRTFLEAQEPNNVMGVVDYLKKEKTPVNELNTRDYHLVMAHYFRQEEAFEMVARHLELALPTVETRMEKTRYNFILGQIYEMLNRDEIAYARYSEAAQYSPNYELFFHSDLNRSGAARISSAEELAETNEYFQKLLKDEKNTEYQDKIYYEMGIFQFKQKNYEQSIKFLNESIQTSTQNIVQKSYSYLKIAEIYYYQFSDFENAALYYDSAVQIMPPKIKYYADTKEKAEVLGEYVKYLKMVRGADRLVALSKMDNPARIAFLEAEIEEEKEAILKRKENEKLVAQRRKSIEQKSTQTTDNQAEGGGWYFYNSQAQAAGQSNFIRKWGVRKLEDNWRRSGRDFVFADENANNNQPNTNAPNQGKGKKNDDAEEDPFASVKSLEDRLADIPDTEPQMEAVRKQLEEGLFGLGKVYYYRLKDYPNTIATFTRQYQEFPKGEMTPEALYLMYTLCKESQTCDPETYKQIIIKEYPEHFYAKILINPRYVEETNIFNAQVEDFYQRSYALYKEGFYADSDSLLSYTMQQYPNNGLEDKMDLLRVMNQYKIHDDIRLYYRELVGFTRKYGDSPLVPFAKNLMEAIPAWHRKEE